MPLGVLTNCQTNPPTAKTATAAITIESARERGRRLALPVLAGFERERI